MLSVISHQENGNQTRSEILPIHEDGSNQKTGNNKCWQECEKIGISHSTGGNVK